MLDNTIVDYAELAPEFELTVVIRNQNGDKIGTKSITTDSPGKLAAFYHNNKGKPKRKRKRKTPKKHLPKGVEAEKILEAANKYADEVQAKRTKPPKEE